MSVSQSVCTEHCAGCHRYASLAFMLKKLRSQDVERYFKQWFLKHLRLSRVGGLITHDEGRGEQAGDIGSEASPLGEVRKWCGRRGQCSQTSGALPAEGQSWAGRPGRHVEASLCPCNWTGTFLVRQSILGEKAWHSRGPVPVPV